MARDLSHTKTPLAIKRQQVTVHKNAVQRYAGKMQERWQLIAKLEHEIKELEKDDLDASTK